MSYQIIDNRIELKGRRKELRNKSTQAEKHLWKYLQKSQLADCKFRRQVSIDSYVVDFLCNEKKLVIELDGEYHFEKETIEYDKKRTKFLESLGLTVIRFENQDVLYDTERVLKEIEKFLKYKINLSPP